MQANIITT